MTRVGTMMECMVIINKWSSLNIMKAHNRSSSKVLVNKTGWTTIKYINILHHRSRTISDTKIVRRMFLGPATQLMNTVSVFEYFLNRVTVADPIKVLVPKLSTVIG